VRRKIEAYISNCSDSIGLEADMRGMIQECHDDAVTRTGAVWPAITAALKSMLEALTPAHKKRKRKKKKKKNTGSASAVPQVCPLTI